MILKIKQFRVLDDFNLEIQFNTGELKIVSLQNELYGEVFEALKDPIFFNQAFLTEWNVIQWPNGADFAPEYLYQIGRKLAA